MEVRANLKYTRLGAQKARLVADLVRGKGVNEALSALAFLDRKGAVVLKKLIESAVANAERDAVIDVDNLYVKTITVDQAPSFKRFRPRAQGRASPVKKRQSHIKLVLDER